MKFSFCVISAHTRLLIIISVFCNIKYSQIEENYAKCVYSNLPALPSTADGKVNTLLNSKITLPLDIFDAK